MAEASFPSRAVTRPPRMPALRLLIFLLPVFSHLPHLQMAFLGMRERPQATGMSPVLAGPQPFAIKGRRLRCPVPAGAEPCPVLACGQRKLCAWGAALSFPFSALGSERPPPLSEGSCPARGNKVVQSCNSASELELNQPWVRILHIISFFLFFLTFYFVLRYNPMGLSGWH